VASLDSTRTAPNPQDGYSDSVLAKAVWEPGDSHTLRFSIEQSRSDVFSDVITARTSSPALTVLSLLGNDEQERRRFALEHEFRGLGLALLDGGEWRIYRQDGETTQYTSEERRVVAGATTSLRLRDRVFRFNEDSVGGELTLRKALDTGAVSHQFTWGVELLQTDIDQLRDGYELNRTTGVRTAFVGIETFPVRDTPLTRTRETGLYLQDELRIGAWTITPSVRVDRYELDPTTDAIFGADNPGITPTSLTDTTVSPRLGIVWRASDRITAFASYSAGFRSPPFGDVNVGLTNSLARYTTLPNADLKPETSDNFELGLRWSRGAAFASLSVYANRFDDFIESFSFIGIQPGTGFTLFQSRNVDEVEIHGVELKGELPLAGLLPGLALRAAASWGEGDDRNADQPLNTVDPARAVVGLEYRRLGAPLGRRAGHDRGRAQATHQPGGRPVLRAARLRDARPAGRLAAVRARPGRPRGIQPDGSPLLGVDGRPRSSRERHHSRFLHSSRAQHRCAVAPDLVSVARPGAGDMRAAFVPDANMRAVTTV
jgi:hemoglobin/transferrin/lactoferrin receptor protein